MIGAAGAIAAAIVAGIQLTAIANLQPVAAIVAAAGAAVALLAIGSVLLGATRVLAIESPTLTELSNEELNAPPAVDGKSSSSLITWVFERRTSLLGDATSITNLYADGVVGAKRALDVLRRGEKSTWADRELDPESASDVAWLEGEYAAATARVGRLEEAAGYWQRRRAYSDLIDKAPMLFTFFILGILVFAIMPVWGRTSLTSEIKAPIPAQIYVRDATAADVPADCPARLSGQIVGGSLDKPIVVTVPTESCPALKLTVQDDALIVVPNPTGSSAPNG
jgi:hypothetical protein